MRLVIWIVLALGLPSLAAAADFRLADLHGSWQGDGIYRSGDLHGRMKCRLVIMAEAGKARITGRCASSVGNEAFDLALARQADGSIRAGSRGTPSRPGSAIRSIRGTPRDGTLFLEGNAREEQLRIVLVLQEDRRLRFTSFHALDGVIESAVVTLSRTP